MSLTKNSLTRLIQSHPLAQGLQVAFNFAEGPGLQSYDSGPRQIVATPNGTGQFGAVASPYGWAKTFAANAAWYSTNYTALLQDFTAIVLFYNTAGHTGGNSRLLDKSYNNGFYLGTNSGGTLMGGGCQQTSAPYGDFTTFSTNTWHQLAMTRSGTTKTMYKDGTSFATVTVSGAAFDSTPLGINAVAGTGAPQLGVPIAQVLVYNRALTDAEIARHWQDPFCMFRARSWMLTVPVANNTSLFFPFFD